MTPTAEENKKPINEIKQSNDENKNDKNTKVDNKNKPKNAAPATKPNNINKATVIFKNFLFNFFLILTRFDNFKKTTVKTENKQPNNFSVPKEDNQVKFCISFDF